MTEQELIEFRARCVSAKVYNRKIANAEVYMSELEREVGPIPILGIPVGSADHLIALIDAVLRVRAGEMPKPVSKVSKVRPTAKAKAKPTKKPVPKVTPKAKAVPKTKVTPKPTPKPVKPAAAVKSPAKAKKAEAKKVEKKNR